MSKNEFKFTGKIDKILDSKTGKGANGNWKSIEFLVKEEKDEYPQACLFRLFGVDKVDNFLQYNKVGSMVDVSFNLNANELDDGRVFNNISAWKVFKAKDEVVVEDDDIEDDDGSECRPYSSRTCDHLIKSHVDIFLVFRVFS